MRIALATDAWTPQTNGVVTTLKATAATLTLAGHEVRIISPQGLATIACPSYPEIRLALSPGAYVARELKAFRPHAPVKSRGNTVTRHRDVAPLLSPGQRHALS